MGISKLVFSFFFLFINFSSSMNSNHRCPDEQRDALLVFKQNISSMHRSYVLYSKDYEYCKDLHGSQYVPIKINWETSIDCCDWKGISCDNFTGDVVLLNLECGNLKGVTELDILLSGLPKLAAIDLSYSGLSVLTRNDARNVNSDLYELSLASCNLHVFPYFLSAMKNLQFLDLSNNYISGHITSLPQFTSEGLQYLNMQSNKLHGIFPPWICNMKHLKYLDVSENYISGTIPRCLGNMSSSLESLSVKSNYLEGSFPPWICNMKHLKYLDVSDNNISGTIPRCLGNMSSSLVTLKVNANRLQGLFPTSVCNMDRLLYLDMSYNSLYGLLPQCFGNMTSSFALINLGKNMFHGTIPKVYGNCGLSTGLILEGNMFEGEVPRSLAKCQSIKVLDLGNNQLNGTFPRWLGDLQKLQVLVLTSNNFHGTIETPATIEFLFPSLRIFDISSNGFVGHLPEKYFESFNAIKDEEKEPKTQSENISDLPSYSINVPLKGGYLDRIDILVNVIDLSSNKFDGEIPNVIGNLKSLKLLNLSHNNLNGQIPHVLGNLLQMEALDLSTNQLEGEIPQSLTHLHYLSFFNVSQNHLVGRIPIGTQFQLFSKDSYLGNQGLCGPPLQTDCEDLRSPKAEAKGSGRWIYVESLMLGFGFGTLLGVVLGNVMLATGRPKWLNAIVEAAGGHTRPKKRKQVHIRKRN